MYPYFAVDIRAGLFYMRYPTKILLTFCYPAAAVPLSRGEKTCGRRRRLI